MGHDAGEPFKGAYGRFSHPERYRVLHEWGWELLDRLDEEFDVERVDATGDEPSPIPSDVDAPAVLLVPGDPRAGSLTLVFHSLPGLKVRCGRWCDFRLPDCGCDGCDEDPAELWDELEEHATALVSGNFSERLSRRHGVWHVEHEIPGQESGGHEVRYVETDRNSGWFSSMSGWGAVDPQQLGLPGAVEWSNWPRRDGRP